MAKKKRSSFLCMCAIAVSCESEASMFLDQPAENNVHAGEEVEVVVVDNPSATPSTSVDSEVAKDTTREPELDETMISPYACAPVVIDCGPGLATYCVPKHLLRSPKWSTTDAGGTVDLPGVSAATGHTLVHYLYTGTYQPLEARSDDAASMAPIKFKQALLAFALATMYELPDLEGLAKEQIRTHGYSMALDEVLDIARKCTWFPKMAFSWFHEYLQARANLQFSLDYRYFTCKAYIDSVGDGKLHRFMTCHLLETFTEKLTHVPQKWEGHCVNEERADAVFDGVEDTAGKAHCFSRCHGRHPTGSRIESLRMSSVSDWELEPALAPEPEEKEEYDPWSFSSSSTGKNKKKKKRGAVEEPLPEPEPVIDSVPEPVPEPEPVKEEDPWGFAATTGRRSKNKKAQDEPKDKEPQSSEPEPEATCESTPPPPEAEPERVEELAVDPFVGLSKMQKDDPWASCGAATMTEKKKKKKKGVKEELRVEEPPPPPPEPFIEPEPSQPTKQKAKDNWGDWGATAAPIKKSEQKKGVAAMISEPPTEEPISEPEVVIIPGTTAELELVEEKDNGGDWEFSSIWGGGKKKNDTNKGALVEQEQKRAEDVAVEEEEKPMQESMPEISSVLCPRRSHHLSEGDGWKSCERCRAMIRELAAQLE
ncbi:hypothetical protein J4E82_011436 [Alternaria postmessia]|uniref:uncharacterized protein n=1 Tax=Alternaria postmessia TaxID=1187938 RepID=UPI0022250334|nr:uncharacterized protein J4E82_011436 [Alternaria postmessia]KAH8622003.1 hypothetical protein IG631_23398 [Alternaria alternata]KAI5364448.1 hypothetical protein J4E82_011436 [Alternaria postmessia]